MTTEAGEVVAATSGLVRTGQHLTVAFGEAAAAGLGFPCVAKVDDELFGLVKVVHASMVNL